MLGGFPRPPGNSKIQRTDEWIEKDNKSYHERQFKEPYRSTIAFCDWLERCGYLPPGSEQNIVDIGTGQGANVLYMAKRFPAGRFVGLDINEENIAIGNAALAKAGVTNAHLEVGDVYALDDKHLAAYDGIVSLQTLSWLPGFEKPLDRLTALGGKWLALTSLFYAGPVSCQIAVKQYDRNLQQDVDIDIDLPRPESGAMTTYTEELKDGRRLQISGPLLMPWYFIGCERS